MGRQIREPKNVIERALITSHGADLNLDLPDEPKTTGPAPSALPTANGGVITDAQLRNLERNNMHAARKPPTANCSARAAPLNCWGSSPRHWRRG